MMLDDDLDAESALAELLTAGAVVLDTHWNRAEWPGAARDTIRVLVLCRDVFAWGQADWEEVGQGQILALHRCWKRDQRLGTIIWCCLARQEQPRKPVADVIRAAGMWDASGLGGLRPNRYDAILAAREVCAG